MWHVIPCCGKRSSWYGWRTHLTPVALAPLRYDLFAHGRSKRNRTLLSSWSSVRQSSRDSLLPLPPYHVLVPFVRDDPSCRAADPSCSSASLPLFSLPDLASSHSSKLSVASPSAQARTVLPNPTQPPSTSARPTCPTQPRPRRCGGEGRLGAARECSLSYPSTVLITLVVVVAVAVAVPWVAEADERRAVLTAMLAFTCHLRV